MLQQHHAIDSKLYYITLFQFSLHEDFSSINKSVVQTIHMHVETWGWKTCPFQDRGIGYFRAV